MTHNNNVNITFYDQNAAQLVEQYNSVSFQKVHPTLGSLLRSAKTVLDVGCGSGRDAVAMAALGLEVVAVDPSLPMLSHAKALGGENVCFLHDSLPELAAVKARTQTFDVILLSAVWMHIEPLQRQAAFASLVQVLSPKGKIVVSLRHGEFHDGRKMNPVSFAELQLLSTQHGLQATLCSEQQADVLNRSDVWWELVEISSPAHDCQ